MKVLKGVMMINFMKIFIVSLFCFHSLVVADFEKITEDLRPYSSKISIESIDTILDQNSSLKNKEAFKLDVNKAVQEQAPYAFMSVSFTLYTGHIRSSGEDFGSEIFENSDNSYIVQFLLASIVILDKDKYDADKVQCAVDTLRSSILDGQKAIAGYLGEGSESKLEDILEETKGEEI